VVLTAPSGDYLQETRVFFDLKTNPDPVTYNDDWYHQNITRETLDLSIGSDYDGTYTYVDVWDDLGYDEYWVWPDTEFRYWPEAEGNNPSPFYYMRRNDMSPTGGEAMLWVQTFVVGDGNTNVNRGISTDDYSGVHFRDIWDTLRVNEGGGAPGIGDNNLETVFFKGESDFLAPDYNDRIPNDVIDVIYIPMSRMLWRDR